MCHPVQTAGSIEGVQNTFMMQTGQAFETWYIVHTLLPCTRNSDARGRALIVKAEAHKCMSTKSMLGLACWSSASCPVLLAHLGSTLPGKPRGLYCVYGESALKNPAVVTIQSN